MKLQHTAVIFILIAIPILLVVSYYIGLQIDTITLQTSYNSKLLSATKDALEAFEINSVEWNGQYEDTANNKRRNVEASISTFMNSLANNMKISGANEDYLNAYIPALMMNLYEGYYIYAPITVRETEKDENGCDKVDDSGNIQYTGNTTTEHTLLPFTSYSEQIGDITVNYTLDNYVKIYGDFKCQKEYANYGGDKTKKVREKNADGNFNFPRNATSSYVKEEGYLVYFDSTSNISGASIDTLKYNGEAITTETLSENVTYKDGNIYNMDSYKYIYIEDSQGDKTKLYYDDKVASGNNWFTVDSKYQKNYLTDNVTNVTQYVYKKVSLPSQESDGLTRYINFYQVLNGDEKGNWYADWDDDGELPPSEKVDSTTYGLDTIKLYEDCSSIKYYVQAYYFTRWVTNVVADNLETYRDVFQITNGYNNDGSINEEGNDPGNPETAQYSKFYQHKNTVIQEQIMDSLAQAIYTYDGGDGVLPNLNAVEWEQILSNVSMVSFMQGIPIGLKQYNGYAIATSTSNREYVDPNELYFVENDSTNTDEYYHQCYCKKKTGTTYQGYRAIDFIEKSYTDNDGSKKYYYLHNTGTLSSMECYYCLVNRANYTKTTDLNKISDASQEYNTALSRERYRANQDVIMAKDYAEFKVTKDASDPSESYGRKYYTIGDTITWKITIENIGKASGTAYIEDSGACFPDGLKLVSVSCDTTQATNGVTDYNFYTVEKGFKGFVTIEANKNAYIVLKTKVTADVTLGVITNTVIIKNSATSEYSIDSATANTNIEKSVTLSTKGTGVDSYKFILILDNSMSLVGRQSEVLSSANKFINDMYAKASNSGVNIEFAAIDFNSDAGDLKIEEKNGKYSITNYNILTSTFGTNYVSALELAREKMDENKKNVVIFFTDGAPTLIQGENNAFKKLFSNIPIISHIFGIVVDSSWLETYCLKGFEFKYTIALVQALTANYGKMLPAIDAVKEIWTNTSTGIFAYAQAIKDFNNTKEEKYHTELYTVFYDTHNKETAGFGLEVISSNCDNCFTSLKKKETVIDDKSGYYYTSSNESELIKNFENIANKSIPTKESEVQKSTSGGLLDLEGNGYSLSNITGIDITKNGTTTTLTLEQAKNAGYVTSENKIDVNKIGAGATITINFHG